MPNAPLIQYICKMLEVMLMHSGPEAQEAQIRPRLATAIVAELCL